MAIDKKQIVKLFKKGVSKKRIATDMGCSRMYVYAVLTKAGIHKIKKSRVTR